MSWKIFDEAVDMLERRFRYFPRAFRWRGQRYEVEAVERCWTVSKSGWRRRVERHYFLVHCDEGAFELYQDLKAGTWHLRRARLKRVQPGAPMRRMAPAWR
jgi:hypothetical protein